MATHSIHLADPDPHPAAKPSRRRGDGPRLVIAALAAAVLVAAVLILGPAGLIPFGLLLVLSTDPDEDNGRRSVILTRRNLGVAAVMALALAWMWLWHVDLTESVLVLIGGALIALPLSLQDPAGHAAARRTVAITKRSLVLALWGLVVFVNLTYAYGQSWNMLAAVCLVLPLVLAVYPGMERPTRTARARAAPPPAPPRAATPPGAGPQHLAVLRTPRWRGGRRRHPLRQDWVLPERS